LWLLYDEGDAGQYGPAFNKSEVQVWNHSGSWAAVGSMQKPEEINGLKAVTTGAWQQPGTFVIAGALVEQALLSVLPVRFTDVKVTALPHAVQIAFANATESDVARYEVERSANGIDFSTIATLQPLHNNGGPAAYQWQDRSRPAGHSFYRIKGVENDGKVVYSLILKITIDGPKAFAVFPNPLAGRQLTWSASLPQGRYGLRITGSNGQVLVQQQFDYSGGHTSQVLTLPAGLKPGVYTLHLVNGNFIRQQAFVVL